jgi:WD40 repeat protein
VHDPSALHYRPIDEPVSDRSMGVQLMRMSRLSLALAVALLTAGAVLIWDAGAQAQKPGWLGADLQDVSKEEADKLGWETARGAKVVRPRTGSPAEVVGLQAGDVIAALDGVEVESMSAFMSEVAAKGAGTSVRLRLLRAGKERTIRVTLSSRDVLAGADTPQLVLESGGHTSTVRGLAFTPDSRQIVSGSQDNTVRVWDIESRKTVRIIRGESMGSRWGPIYDIALSPDGRWLAVGGLFHDTDPPVGAAVRLYDFASGRMEALLQGHDQVVWSLAFSPDSTRLVSGAFDRTAIVWDLATRRQLVRLTGHKGYVHAAAFTSDGERVVTVGADRTVRLWSARDGKPIAEGTGHTDGVEAVAVSPTEPLVASGSRDGRILLWDARQGTMLRELSTVDGTELSVGKVRSLAFSPDGRWLLSAFDDLRGCRIHEVATGKRIQIEHDKSCGGSAALSPDGHLAAISTNADVLVADAAQGRVGGRLRGTGTRVGGVGFTPDGRSIGWGQEPHYLANGLTHRLRLPTGTRPMTGVEVLTEPEERKAFLHSVRRAGPWSVELDRKAGKCCVLLILKDGSAHAHVDILDGQFGRFGILAVVPDKQTVLVGMQSEIRSYDLDGRFLGTYGMHEGQVLDLAPSPDGRFLVSGAADQTVRLWNLKTRELVGTLFHGRDGEWVMWTPQGYYTGSPGADKIVGWQINDGPDQVPDFVGADQLRRHLHRPDIVEKAIVLASAEQAVREAPGTSFKLADLIERPVPRFRIVAPAADAGGSGGRASVKIAIEATPDPVRLIRVQVNGRQVEEQTPDVGSGGFGAAERVLDVPLAKGRNEVRITLANAVGERSETIVLTHAGEGALDKRGTLHILAIGVNEYKGLGASCGEAGCDLRYSVADARKMAEAVARRLGPGHDRVVTRLLVNGGSRVDAPTAANIIDAVELLRQAVETDTVVLFIAGHGVNDGPDYRFLPTDAERKGGALRGSTVVPWQVLQSAVEAAKGRRILLVDTCHAGNAYNQRLGNAAYHANILAYTAARFDQEALEDARLGHGLFTYALVEGLDGAGGLGAKRRISTRELAGYVVRRVGELAKALDGEQEPQYFKGRDADDYVLAQW